MGCGTSKPKVVDSQSPKRVVTTAKKTISEETGTSDDNSKLYDSDYNSSMVPELHTIVEPSDNNWYYEDESETANQEICNDKRSTLSSLKSDNPKQAFVALLSREVIGREPTLSGISGYISGAPSHVPLLLHGKPGEGKTSVLAKAVTTTATNIQELNVSSRNGVDWRLFYHFVGSIPKSSNLQTMLRSLLHDVGAVNEFTLPRTLNGLIQTTSALLSNPFCRPLVIVIDSLNQFDDVFEDDVIRWIPRQLSPTVRLICSTTTNSTAHCKLKNRIPSIDEITLPSLRQSDLQKIIYDKMVKHKRKLSNKQIETLLSKYNKTNNLVWLSMVCDVIGLLDEAGGEERIRNIAGNIDRVLADVVTRFEDTKDRLDRVIVGFLFLLQFSNQGMTMSELKWILGDRETIFPVHIDGLGDIRITFNRVYEQLSDNDWQIVYNAVHPFTSKLEDGDDDKDVRLGIRHLSIGHAIQQMNFLDGEDEKVSDEERSENREWWHSKLSDYFELDTNLERKLEEYPYHVCKVGQEGAIVKCFTEWQILERLLQDQLPWLLFAWKQVSTSENMIEIYQDALQELHKTEGNSEFVAHCFSLAAQLMYNAELYSTAKDFIVTAIDICKGHGDLEKLVEMYTMAGIILHEHLHSNSDTITNERKDELRQLLRYYKDSLKIRQNLYYTEDKHKYLMAATQCKYVENLHWWMLLGGDKSFTSHEAKKDATLHVDEAIRISKEVKNFGMLAEAITNKATLDDELKLYAEAIEICLRAFGENHLLTARLNGYIARYYEKDSDWKRAGRHYSLQLKIFTEVLGSDHWRTMETKQKFHNPKLKEFLLGR